MTYRFSQDHLELFFAQVRRRNSWNNNPNVLQFKSAMKQLLMKNSVSASTVANCLEFDNCNDIGFKLQWKKRNEIKNWHDNEMFSVTEADNNNNDSDIDENIASDTFIKDNIMFYIAGFIVKKILKTITCEGCIDNIIRNVKDRKNNFMPHTLFTDAKNNSGLVYASENVMKILRSTEKEFLVSIRDGGITRKKNMFRSIVSRMVREYALRRDVFSFDDKCFASEEFLGTPHRVQLISTICEKYLIIRNHSYSKFYNREILNSVSIRQKFSKLILFKNT